MIGGFYPGQTYPGGIGESGLIQVGRDLVLPYGMTGQAARALALPYTVNGPTGRLLVLPYSIIAYRGKSVVLPFDVTGTVGRSVVLPYAILTPSAIAGKEITDTYADGPSDPFGIGSWLGVNLSLFGTFIAAEDWEPPADLDEMQYGRLPYSLAQSVFGSADVDPATLTRATCGWHGLKFDLQRGSFAIVARDGPLADLVGERVRVRRTGYRPRAVYVYVHDEALLEGDEDISLPRRQFMALDLLAKTTLEVVVEVVP